jgi:hypothetical protein
MTGEMTLRGEVLPVGGIREKVVAARRIGVHTVILPERNRADVEEIPREVREHVEFVFASTYDQVLEAALSEAKPKKAAKAERPAGGEGKRNGHAHEGGRSSKRSGGTREGGRSDRGDGGAPEGSRRPEEDRTRRSGLRNHRDAAPVGRGVRPR